MKKSARKQIKVDEKRLKEAAERALKQPRLAFYSPLASCILNYWKNVVPRYSISDELARIVEAELRSRWPGLAVKADKMLRRGRR
ncbi:MAG TPA: hypothetical protein EYH45_02175 [Candidatus Caldiarchaeum subterraneum]|uniref:Uncharacterized protein n=1 Tax=Caldiarchaeum subterraneum TaxID=311458 RepID=A0A832ZV10_CALS0|nr:hypothetical protein [Candidatus Caldarchaeum subterraneum]